MRTRTACRDASSALAGHDVADWLSVTWAGRALPRSFFARDALDVAPALLNKVLVHGGCAARIVEVEAYRGAEDPASHAYRGQTPRNATMFGPPGHLYVYFTYGMHWCANAVCAGPGVAMAVLLRAGEPLVGVEDMYARRPAAKRERDLCSGPAKLCQALGINGELDGADVVTGAQGVGLRDDGAAPPTAPLVTRRIGLTRAVENLWRFSVPGSRHVSRP